MSALRAYPCTALLNALVLSHKKSTSRPCKCVSPNVSTAHKMPRSSSWLICVSRSSKERKTQSGTRLLHTNCSWVTPDSRGGLTPRGPIGGGSDLAHNMGYMRRCSLAHVPPRMCAQDRRLRHFQIHLELWQRIFSSSHPHLTFSVVHVRVHCLITIWKGLPHLQGLQTPPISMIPTISGTLKAGC